MDIRPVIVFAKSSFERDYLRSLIVRQDSSVLCFERETICFDNLRSINPDTIVVRTDERSVAWRFILAIYTLKTATNLVLLSNELSESFFDLYGLKIAVNFLPIEYGEKGFVQAFLRLVSSGHSVDSPVCQQLLVGESEAIRRINAMLPSLKEANEPILISGERGTGKELLARFIADVTASSVFFIKIDCAALQAQPLRVCCCAETTSNTHMTESLDKIGAINGKKLILLDKIENLNKKAQGEVLLLMEDQSSRRGQDPTMQIRFIATCQADLQDRVKRDLFRKELFYRLNVIPVQLPSLRNRIVDIPLLCDYFSILGCSQMKQSFMFPSAKMMARFSDYHWPGNIDELKRMINEFIATGSERSFPFYGEMSKSKNESPNLFYQAMVTEAEPTVLEIKNYLPALSDFSLKHICEKFACRTEKKLMQKALEKTNWNRKKAAALLKISYKSMLNKMKLYEIV